jgi:hypothetical protein
MPNVDLDRRVNLIAFEPDQRSLRFEIQRIFWHPSPEPSVTERRRAGHACLLAGAVGREQRVEFAPEPDLEPAFTVDGPGDQRTVVGRLDALREP